MSLLKLSVSRTKTFLQCKKKYHFVYILKLPQKQQDFHILGRFCHLVLELFHRAYLNGSTLLFYQQMEIVWREAFSEYQHQLSADSRKEAYAIIDGYLQFLARKDKDYVARVLDVERNFTLAITEQVGLTGMIDVISEETDGTLCVADYKTTKNKKYLANDFLQLQTYAWVLMQDNPKITKIKCSYILLRHNCEEISKEFTRDEILPIQNIYQEYAKQIMEEQTWTANPGVLCGYCDFQKQCPDGQSIIRNNFSMRETRNFNHGKTKW